MKIFALLALFVWVSAVADSGLFEAISRVSYHSIARGSNGSVIIYAPRVAGCCDTYPVSGHADVQALCRAFGYSQYYFNQKDPNASFQRSPFMTPNGGTVMVLRGKRAHLYYGDTSYITQVSCR